jgi:Uma2 family endonuclease
MSEPQLLTYSDLEAIPYDGKRRELLDGELIVSPSPKTRHQRLVGRLFQSIDLHVQEHGGGEVFIAPLDILLSKSNVVDPDVFFVAEASAEVVTEKNIQGVPDLLIEVLSDPRIDRVRKRDIYAQFGVPESWIVDPDADRVEVYRHDGTGYPKPEIYEPGEILTYQGLPGFSLDLERLFAR